MNRKEDENQIFFLKKKKKKKKHTHTHTHTQTQTSLPVGCHPDIFHCMKTLNYSNS